MKDSVLIEAFQYLASRARLTPHEQEELMNIICDHKYENWNDGYGNDWNRCRICGKLKVKE